jgi:hypothetical protein
MGGDSELASREYCPGSPPGSDPDRSCNYPRQTAYLEGNSGADGVAKPDQPLDASQGGEQKGVRQSCGALSARGLPERGKGLASSSRAIRVLPSRLPSFFMPLQAV